jgi:CubicO group peptidase (beta-lactamase class C family)
MAAPQIHGECDERFRAVRDAFLANFTERGEVGSAVAVYYRGRKVVDLWGGVQDKETRVPWHHDTVSIMFSLAKAMCALSVHILADRRLIDVQAPVARYWPEFTRGDARKDAVLVRHVLSHHCGMIFNDHAREGDIYDFDAMIRALELQELPWMPGEKPAYNTTNIGYLLGKLVLNITGVPVNEFIQRNICGPLGADYHIGLTEADLPRVATLYPTATINEQFRTGATPGTNMARAWTAMPKPWSVERLNSREIRLGMVPSFGGHGTARGMARIYAALAGGGDLDGVHLLSRATIERAQTLQWDVERDEILGRPLRMSMGFFKNKPGWVPMGPNLEAFGHFGSGGALTFADMERNLAFACQSNFQCEGQSVGERTTALVEATFKGLA